MNRQCEFWLDDDTQCTNPARFKVQPILGGNIAQLAACVDCYDRCMEAGIWEDATYEN